MLPQNAQYLRRGSLMVVNGDKVLDLSNFHFRFETVQQDEESPNNCSIRIYNLRPETIRQIKEEYTRVVLQAGYETGPFGVIFDGTIKQYRSGRETPVNTYLDILAADGDVAYNWAIVNQSLLAGNDHAQRVNALVKSMEPKGATKGSVVYPSTGGVLPRGKVLFGYAKVLMRQQANSMGSTWNINNGKVNIVPLDGYLPGEAVLLTAATGLIGRPEQTQEGIKARCLLNPKIVVGGLVKIDNQSINQTTHKDPNVPVAYNQYGGVQNLASVTEDGLYRVYVAEHSGDVRGIPWWTEIICLTVNPVTEKVQPYG